MTQLTQWTVNAFGWAAGNKAAPGGWPCQQTFLVSGLIIQWKLAVRDKTWWNLKNFRFTLCSVNCSASPELWSVPCVCSLPRAVKTLCLTFLRCAASFCKCWMGHQLSQHCSRCSAEYQLKISHLHLLTLWYIWSPVQ